MALILFTKRKKLFNNIYCNPIIIILVLGVSGILSSKEKELKNTYKFDYSETLKTNSSKSATIYLEKNTASKLIASVRFVENEKGKFAPIFTRINYSGFVGGHQWELMSVIVNPNIDKKFS
ncbi:hypothetical protein [Kordia sp.]|uniref:hypothetical protein n=1 Tax=Kordia sp. TaxID=1965332 RepID=UPI003D2C1A65